MLRAGTSPPLDAPLAWGTAGWRDDTDETYVDFDDGSGSGSQTGITVVRVTLYRGRTPTDPIDDARAQGWQILCQLGSPDMMVPPRGTRVLVAMPEPHGQHAGNGTIVGVVDARGKTAYGSVKPGERSVMALAGFGQLLLQEDGTAILQTQSNNESGGGAVAVTANPDGTVCLGSLSPADVVAIGRLVDGDFHSIASAASTLNTTMTALSPIPPVSLPQALADIGAIVAALIAFSQSLSSFEATGSSKVKAVS